MIAGPRCRRIWPAVGGLIVALLIAVPAPRAAAATGGAAGTGPG